jgi:hypothetical protein
MENVQVRESSTTVKTRKKYQSNGYVDAGDTDVEYCFILNRADYEVGDDPYTLSIPIEFEVYTGSVFENAGLMYGNYKIDVSAQCLSTAASEKGVALAKQYIIYTNAKLLPEFVPVSN